MSRKLKGNLMLLLTAFIWGTAFVAQSEGMNYVGPFTYCAVRNILGGLVLIPVILLFRSKKFRDKSDRQVSIKETFKGGILCGAILCVASGLQQLGISMTTAGKAGFISAIYIIAVPIVELFIFKKKSVFVWICALVALAGLYLLCVNESFSINQGDLIVLCSAFCFTAHIMVIDHFNGKGADGVMMSCIQFFTAAIFMTAAMFIFEQLTLTIALGFKQMVPAILILTFAWTLKTMTNLLDAGTFVSDIVESATAIQILLPLILFVVAVGLSFATGTSWGTFGILILIVTSVFSAELLNVTTTGEIPSMVIICISASLAGAVCGDHCSPISDTTIMASTGAQCDHVNHVSTQLPYVMTVAAVSAVGYLLSGFVQNVFVVLGVSVALMLIVLFVIKALTKGKITEQAK